MNKNTINEFSSFKLSPALLSAIKKVAYVRPTSIQSEAIPTILTGGDVLASAETGSGKTAAFVLPLLHKITEQKEADGWMVYKGAHVRALILVPTRELVVQIRDEVKALAQDIKPEIRCMSVYGGVKLDSQVAAVKSGVDVLIATPNRLLELNQQHALSFNKLQTLVLDEADRLVNTHFKDEIEAIFKLLPNKRQNLLFTATFPESIRSLVRSLLDHPTIIKHEQNTDLFIDQHVVTVNFDRKYGLLAHLLKENDWKQVLVFCSAKKGCDRLAEKLLEYDIEAVVLHGNKPQKERLAALSDFKSGKARILIATDVASRGVDVEQLDCVINFELPRSPNDYIHRIGRTGRAGKKGQAISLISHHEYAHFKVIEKRNDLRLEREQVKGFEASKVAPEAPARKKPKKQKSKKQLKLSKKKRLRLQKKLKEKYDSNANSSETYRESSDHSKAKPSKKVEKTLERKKESAKDQPIDKTSPYSKKSDKSKPKLKPKQESSKKTTLKKIPNSDKVDAKKTTEKKEVTPVEASKAETQVNEHVWGKR